MGGLRRSRTDSRQKKRWDLKPRQSVDVVKPGLAPRAGGLGSSRRRVRLGSALQQAGRRAEEKELPSALCVEGWSGLGCTWWMLGRVGSMLVGWVGSVGFALLSAPLEPWSWKYRLCTDGAPCTPGHTWAPPKVGMFQRTCRSGSLGKGVAGTVPDLVACLPSAGTQPMVGWKPWK